MAVVYLALGTNLGDRQKNLLEAVDKIREKIGPVEALSSFMETCPEGFSSPHRFLNAVLKVNCELLPSDLLTTTWNIEREMGRVSKSKNGIYHDRIIDIDILFYDSLVVHSATLIIPHPHIQKRFFVLRPLVEIAPNFVHPLLGKTIREILSDAEQHGILENFRSEK